MRNFNKRGMNYKYFSLVIILLIYTICVGAAETTDLGEGTTEPGVQDIADEVSSGNVVRAEDHSLGDFKGYLKNKWKILFQATQPGGNSIQSNQLSTPGGVVAMDTGKEILVEVKGLLLYVDDGAGTVIDGGTGVNYGKDILSAVTAQQITYQGTTSTNVQNYAVNQGIITASSAETFTVAGASTGCTNCKDITFSQDVFKVSSADKIDYYGSTSEAVNTYEGKKGTFTVKSAENVTIGNNTFSNVENSVFSVIGNKLVYADVKSSKDNNTAILENPIQGSSDNFTY